MIYPKQALGGVVMATAGSDKPGIAYQIAQHTKALVYLDEGFCIQHGCFILPGA